MFENMTPREKKLALAVGALLPITLLFVAFYWFLGKYNDNNGRLQTATQNYDAEFNKFEQGMLADRRMQYYNSVALPPEVNAATNNYEGWLKLTFDELGMTNPTFKRLDAGVMQTSMGSTPIGRKKTIQVQTKATLEQLNQFLAKFYSIDLLHRINTMRVIPQTEGTGKKKVRTGLLSLTMTIEILSLTDADNRDEFMIPSDERKRDETYYTNILRRNIFGPANSRPTVTVRASSVRTGSDASVTVTAKDADDADLLKIELVKSSVDGIQLKPSTDPKSRSTRFTVPSQEPGKYEFAVKVSDNGLPPKETIETFSVTFREKLKQKTETVKEEPKKPEFKHATQTRVTGIARNRDGNWQAFIKVRTTDDRYRLSVGEKFELDKAQWEVTSINESEVKFQVGEKTYVARPNPRERGVLVELN